MDPSSILQLAQMVDQFVASQSATQLNSIRGLLKTSGVSDDNIDKFITFIQHPEDSVLGNFIPDNMPQGLTDIIMRFSPEERPDGYQDDDGGEGDVDPDTGLPAAYAEFDVLSPSGPENDAETAVVAETGNSGDGENPERNYLEDWLDLLAGGDTPGEAEITDIASEPNDMQVSDEDVVELFARSAGVGDDPPESTSDTPEGATIEEPEAAIEGEPPASEESGDPIPEDVDGLAVDAAEDLDAQVDAEGAASVGESESEGAADLLAEGIVGEDSEAAGDDLDAGEAGDDDAAAEEGPASEAAGEEGSGTDSQAAEDTRSATPDDVVTDQATPVSASDANDLLAEDLTATMRGQGRGDDREAADADDPSATRPEGDDPVENLPVTEVAAVVEADRSDSKETSDTQEPQGERTDRSSDDPLETDGGPDLEGNWLSDDALQEIGDGADLVVDWASGVEKTEGTAESIDRISDAGRDTGQQVEAYREARSEWQEVADRVRGADKPSEQDIERLEVLDNIRTTIEARLEVNAARLEAAGQRIDSAHRIDAIERAPDSDRSADDRSALQLEKVRSKNLDAKAENLDAKAEHLNERASALRDGADTSAVDARLRECDAKDAKYDDTGARLDRIGSRMERDAASRDEMTERNDAIGEIPDGERTASDTYALASNGSRIEVLDRRAENDGQQVELLEAKTNAVRDDAQTQAIDAKLKVHEDADRQVSRIEKNIDRIDGQVEAYLERSARFEKGDVSSEASATVKAAAEHLGRVESHADATILDAYKIEARDAQLVASNRDYAMAKTDVSNRDGSTKLSDSSLEAWEKALKHELNSIKEFRSGPRGSESEGNLNDAIGKVAQGKGRDAGDLGQVGDAQGRLERARERDGTDPSQWDASTRLEAVADSLANSRAEARMERAGRLSELRDRGFERRDAIIEAARGVVDARTGAEAKDAYKKLEVARKTDGKESSFDYVERNELQALDRLDAIESRLDADRLADSRYLTQADGKAEGWTEEISQLRAAREDVVEGIKVFEGRIKGGEDLSPREMSDYLRLRSFVSRADALIAQRLTSLQAREFGRLVNPGTQERDSDVRAAVADLRAAHRERLGEVAEARAGNGPLGHEDRSPTPATERIKEARGALDDVQKEYKDAPRPSDVKREAEKQNDTTWQGFKSERAELWGPTLRAGGITEASDKTYDALDNGKIHDVVPGSTLLGHHRECRMLVSPEKGKFDDGQGRIGCREKCHSHDDAGLRQDALDVSKMLVARARAQGDERSDSAIIRSYNYLKADEIRGLAQLARGERPGSDDGPPMPDAVSGQLDVYTFRHEFRKHYRQRHEEGIRSLPASDERIDRLMDRAGGDIDVAKELYDTLKGQVWRNTPWEYLRRYGIDPTINQMRQLFSGGYGDMMKSRLGRDDGPLRSDMQLTGVRKVIARRLDRVGIWGPGMLRNWTENGKPGDDGAEAMLGRLLGAKAVADASKIDDDDLDPDDTDLAAGPEADGASEGPRDEQPSETSAKDENTHIQTINDVLARLEGDTEAIEDLDDLDDDGSLGDVDDTTDLFTGGGADPGMF